MRAVILGVVLGVLLSALPAGHAAAYDAEDPANCNGADTDDGSPLTVSQVIAKPRVNFIKSPYDDDFKAEACPAATQACQRKAYLVTGDLVLVGRTRGAFTCVSYQSPLAKKQVWANGWLPTAALAPVAAMPSPKTADWLGIWYHPGGSIEIKRGTGDKLHIEGGMTVPTANDFHNGDFLAQVVVPKTDTIALVDERDDDCHVRMQRIGPWLMVEDNAECGGAGVSFTGFYRRTSSPASR